jgi:aldehyde:ferredoxin oxidoreductase
MYGFTGKILRVDLSKNEVKIDKPSEEIYRRYLGGAGFVSYFLLKEVPKGANPLGPKNALIFANGPLTGVTVAGGGRNAMGAKSPMNGGYGEADAGGFFGAELKRAGFDAIIIKGKAAKPVYLWINKGKAKIRPAEHLWGMETLECEQAVKKELKEKSVRIASIGPAGEKMVSFACIMNDLLHAAGRTGLGAVMGSKKLKCVVAKGEGQVAVADKEKVRGLATYMREHWKESAEGMHLYGTAGGIEGLNTLGALPTRNFQDGQFKSFKKITGQTMADTILSGTDSCFACPIRCKRVVKVSDKEYKVNSIYGGPEYETIGALGSNCGIDDLRAVSKANEICNAAGMDTITAGMMVSFAMECYENGLISKEMAGGLELNFGNAPAMVKLTEQIATKKGLGKILAAGVEEAIKAIGPKARKFAVAVKNQPFPMHECRVRHGQALGYAVSPTGADHMHNFWDNSMATDPVGEGVKGLGVYKAVPMTVLNGEKIRAYKFESNRQWVGNSIGMCAFIPWSQQQIVDLVSGATGWETNMWELMHAAERCVTLARVFNMREGMTRAADTLPHRIMKEKHYSGTVNEKPVSKEELTGAVSTFYGMMGWDQKTGKPLDATLDELDVGWAKGIV